MRATPPNLPLPPALYERAYFDRLTRDLTLYFTRLNQLGALQGTSLTVTSLVGATTLNTSALAGDTSFILDDATNFPEAGSGTIELEKFSWTSKTGNTLNGVVRGELGTTAVGHTAGVVVVASATPGSVYADPATNALYVVV